MSKLVFRYNELSKLTERVSDEEFDKINETKKILNSRLGGIDTEIHRLSNRISYIERMGQGMIFASIYWCEEVNMEGLGIESLERMIDSLIEEKKSIILWKERLLNNLLIIEDAKIRKI